jgi:hypothetical protein
MWLQLWAIAAEKQDGEQMGTRWRHVDGDTMGARWGQDGDKMGTRWLMGAPKRVGTELGPGMGERPLRHHARSGGTHMIIRSGSF